jgi:hypothetical protein
MQRDNMKFLDHTEFHIINWHQHTFAAFYLGPRFNPILQIPNLIIATAHRVYLLTHFCEKHVCYRMQDTVNLSQFTPLGSIRKTEVLFQSFLTSTKDGI